MHTKHTVRLLFIVVMALFGFSALALAQDEAAIPERFTSGEPVEIALVRFIGDGAFMARYLAGAESMAGELGVELTEYNARNDQAQFVTLLEQAIQQQPDAIIISHGTTDVVQPYIDQAEAAGIPVITFDTVVNSNTVPEIEQDDLAIGFFLTRHVAIEYGGNANILYANIAGFPPLDKRDRSYQNFLWRYPNFRQIAQVGVYVEGGTAAETQTRVEAALTENQDINVVIAMWDELAKGAVRAITQLGRQDDVKVYSVDISDENIQMMREDGSPWEATIATDPYNTARVAVRSAVARIGGETVSKYLLIDPTLVTRDFLLDNNVTNMDELIVALPSLGESELSWYPWIEALAAENAAQ